MEQMHQNDTLVSHRVLNYLLSGYQGEFTYNRILQELGSPEVSPEALKQLEMTLHRITEWYNGLPTGDCLFSAAWKKPETFEAKKSLQLLEELRVIVEKSSQFLRLTASSEGLFGSRDRTRKAAAHIARNAFSARFYSQGAFELAQLVGDKNSVPQFKELAMLGSAQTERVLACVGIIREVGEVPAELQKEFILDMHKAAGALAAQAHDILQIVADYGGSQDALMKSFDPRELAAWEASGIKLIEAGYWRAYGFIPADAARWREFGIGLPGVANTWHLAGFTASDSSRWIEGAVAPEIAAAWRDGGYEVSESLAFLKKGFLTPASLPQGK